MFVSHPAALRDALIATVICGAVAEGVLQRRTRSGGPRDPSYLWMIVGSAAGVALAFAVSGTLDLPGPSWLAGTLGLAVMWAGAALRVWSVRTLGRFFTVEVAVDSAQPVVDTGPYARVRHPSYTGLLIFYLGLGLALDGWVSVTAAVLLPLAAVVNRIHHEERLLLRELGEAYGDYSSRTSRLVPGVW